MEQMTFNDDDKKNNLYYILCDLNSNYIFLIYYIIDSYYNIINKYDRDLYYFYNSF